LVSAADGSVAARYEYGPFGELIRATGPMAKVNPFRFSTKYQDDETGLLYYGYRYYDPSTARWLSRDPLDEAEFRLARADDREKAQGEPNLYSFVRNDPQHRIDVFGLYAEHGHRLAVGKCEIVILYGHGSPTRTYSWRVSKQCAAGAAIMCFSAENSRGLSEDQNLWSTWGGESVTDLPSVMWGMPANGADFYEWGHAHKPNANKVLVAVVAAARVKARDICSKCCCKSVNIAFLQVGKNGEQIVPPSATGGMPAMANFAVPCSR